MPVRSCHFRSARACLLLAAALVLGLAACKKGQSEPLTDSPVLLGPENLTRVESQVLRAGPTITGVLDPLRAAQVRAEVGGQVRELFVEQGESVSAGQPIARLDDTALRDRLVAARSAVRSASDSLRVAQSEVARAARLAKAGGISQRDYEAAESTLTGRRAALAEARAQLATAEQQLQYTRVVAPIDGVVSERLVSVGDVLQQGSALYTIIDPSSMRLAGTVPAQGLEQLEPGKRVDFTVTGYEGRTFSGTISRINPAVDRATNQVRVYVDIPNEGGPLVAGLFAHGRVAALTRKALTAPAEAVDFGTSPPSVVRLRDGRSERVEVKVGLRDAMAERVELAQGVRDGEVLVLGSARAALPDGTRVKVEGPASDRERQREAPRAVGRTPPVSR